MRGMVAIYRLYLAVSGTEQYTCVLVLQRMLQRPSGRICSDAIGEEQKGHKKAILVVRMAVKIIGRGISC